MKGFIYLHRKITEWQWYKNHITRCLFIHLLLKANHKQNYYQGELVKEGELITSLNNLAEQLNLSIKQIRNGLKKLEKTKEIEIKKDKRWTHLIICNYKNYQNYEKEKGKQRANKGQGEGKRGATNNTDNTLNTENTDNSINEDFEKIRVLYRKYKSLRGYQTEYDNFVKKHKDYKQAIEFMINNIDLLEQHLKDKGKYVKDFATFINNRDWELLQGMIDKQKQNRLELEELKRKNDEEAFAFVKDCREPELVEYWKKEAEKGSEFLRLIGAE